MPHNLGPVLSLLHCEGVNNQSYICDSGHCCGNSQCCSYYYELWWFWLVWAIIFLLSCCCVCHHRRTKHRLQQQQRQHEINLIAYREAHNYPAVPFYFRFLPNYLLPDYEEVVNRPQTPPPPYSALHTGPSSVASSPLAHEQPEGHCPATQAAPVAPVSDPLCCRPGVEEPQTPTLDLRPKPDNKPMQTAREPGVILPSDGLNNREGLSSQEKRSESGDDSCKDPLLKEPPEGSVEDKDRLPNGRRRRFTGDSGIEVCVCSTRGSSSFSGAGGAGQEGKELRERESLLGREGNDEEEEEEAGDFCDSCGHRASFGVEEQVLGSGPDRRVARGSSVPPPPPQTSGASLHPPVCLLLLHTINEQEGPQHHSTTTELQG
ncbi:WW domain binding protein 1-like b isoform X1 [Pseudoliparis swirei]|uniref:WW domain binding protein 1-like b isoform X1 n=1 Tax=Pseudoliparis swirei TaxID=2059687 RepID=UPI0024BE7E24|nr:WW domain binding protein 1-like b isoform X1 [Pseudoliparis swirei]